MRNKYPALLSTDRARRFGLLRSLIRGWGLSLLGCGVISLAVAWQMSDSLSLSLSLSDGLWLVARDWLIWSFTVPVIFVIAQRFSVEPSRWKVNAPIYALVYLALLLGIGWLEHTLRFKDVDHHAEERLGNLTVEGNHTPVHPPKPHRTILSQLLFGPHLPIYFAVLGVSHAFCFYRRGREREVRAIELSASLAQARLQALRMQIQPHFLFNTLNALGALIQSDPRAAEDMLIAISDFLRLTLEGSIEQTPTLSRELEYVERYLAIEKVRFGDRLIYVISPSPDTLAAKIPALLLQPLVENAVRHGIEPSQKLGIVTINSWRTNNTLHVTVEDNGVGLATEPSEGVGLANTRSRLRESYRDQAFLTLRSEHGTIVELCVPFQVD